MIGVFADHAGLPFVKPLLFDRLETEVSIESFNLRLAPKAFTSYTYFAAN